MPGPYIHMSAERHTADDLARDEYKPVGSERINPEWEGQDTVRLGKLLRDHPNFANLGAVGPDLFFFLPDFRDEDGVRISSVLVTVLNFVEGLYAAVDPYISKWEHYIGPIEEDTAEEMSRLTGGLSETVGDITGELGSILITALEDFVVQQKDWFEFFSLGLNRGWDEQAFFWSDMLHYRDTGQFGRAIWEQANAADSDEARAYALGYMTHLGTDVTGHAFVNGISGGPFRLHWQRHHLVENHMDAYWYLRDQGGPRSADQYPQFTESALYYDIAFDEESGGAVKRPTYPTGDTLRENWERRRKLDIDSELPDEIANTLLGAIKQVYYDGQPHPMILRDNNGSPSADLIKEAYRLLFRFLKLTTVDGFDHEPPEPPEVFPNLDFPTATDPNDEPPGEDDNSFWDDVLDFILSVVSFIAYVLEVAVWLATLPWAILADLITFPLRLGLYYALELPLFHILKAFRSVLVMSGYLAPMEDEIALGLVQIGTTDKDMFRQVLEDVDDVFGGQNLHTDIDPKTYRDPKYPHRQPEPPDDEYRHPWQYPDSNPECSLTTAGPHPQGAYPKVLFGDVSSDPEIRDRLENARTPSQADSVGGDVQPDRHLGDAIGFSKYLIWLETRSRDQGEGEEVPLVEWNLDSDRGYGYHCWDWNREPKPEDQNQMPQDPEGNRFRQPCTWPPQAQGLFQPGTPLQLHWVPLPDGEKDTCDPPSTVDPETCAPDVIEPN